MRKYLRFLQPELMLTPQIFTAVLIWSTALHFADLRNNPLTHIPQRLLAEVAATAATLAAVWLLSALLVNRVPRDQVWIWMIPVSLIATAIRALVFNGLLNFFAYPSQATLLVRVTASVYSVLFGLWASTIALGVVRTHAMTRSRLLAEQRRLLLAKQTADEQLLDLDDARVDQIKADLHGAVARLSRAPGDEVLPLLRTTIDDVVRPLSQYLQAHAKIWELPHPEQLEPRVRWAEVLRQGLRMDRVMPLTNTLFIIVAGIPTLAQRYELLEVALTLLLGLAVGVGSLTLATRTVGLWTRDAGDVTKAVVFLLCMIVTGILLGLTALPLTADEPEPPAMLLLAALFTPLGGMLVSLASTGIRELDKADQQLEQATADLAWQTARTRASYRQRHRALTHSLHGQVQAALAAAYLRLSPLADQPQLVAEELPGVQADLDRIIETIGASPERVDNCQSVVSKVAANWAGVADLEWRISPAADAILEKDTLARTVLVDLIPELTFNAVKHGEATVISIKLDMASDRELALEVCDNGVGPKLTGRQGLGTELLAECAVDWQRTANPQGQGTCVRARVPVAAEESRSTLPV